MVYELYVDSLFLVNFVMNLYLLILVNRSALRTATRRGMILGACAGALVYLLPFCLALPAWLKWMLAFLAGTGLMAGIAFRPGSFRAFGAIIRQMFRYSFLMGGLFLAAGNALPWTRRFLTEICGVLGAGALGFLLIGYWQEADQRRRSGVCRAVLINGETRVCVSALLDSGNSLREPISGKPVSVIDSRLYQVLWKGIQTPYRAVPYRSVGRQRGIMRGYLLPGLELELDGMTKRFCDVYLAVCEEEGCAELILNPALLEEA
ncbi:MAG: sigma-E processing peptidase SpoIIGA [Muribaculum sp.]|nr:sigma-E processing peptidase SpoIIGA [Muribaculum sp.]